MRKRFLFLAFFLTVFLPLWGSSLLAQDPLVERMVQEVSSSELTSHVRSLSGEVPVFVGSDPETLKTRYSYARGCSLAAEFIAARLTGWGYPVQFHSYMGLELNAVSADPEGRVVTSGQAGRVFYSRDAGNSFRRPPAFSSDDLFAALTTSSDTVLVGGYSGKIFTSFDGGISWQKAYTPYGYSIMALSFDGRKTFWAGGDGGLILKSTDAGLTWQVSVWVAGIVRDICFADSLHGWAVGDMGRIVSTKNGGKSWSVQSSGTSDYLMSVDFADSLRGWACGSSGIVLSTINGGETWTPRSLGGSRWFASIDFIDHLRGWLAGGKGDIYATSDGGLNWVTQYSGVNDYLNSVSFRDSLTGWVAGAGIFLMTDDGGRNWAPSGNLLPESWRNVCAGLDGVTNPGKIVLVTAHYDSYSNQPMSLAPGADDNSSGTSAVMELARVMKSYRFRNSVRFILFSGEEQWMKGSSAYAMSLSGEDTIVAVVNMDMLAWGNDSLTVFGHPRDPWLLETCTLVSSMYAPELPVVLKADSTFIYSDHSTFWDHGYPAILAIERNFQSNPHLHSPTDVFENLNTSLHFKAARFLISLVSHLAAPDSSTTGVPFAMIPRVLSVSSFPNPSRGEIRVRVTIQAGPSDAQLFLFDVGGRVVRRFANKALGTGDHVFLWDGTDEKGRRVPSGQYILLVKVGNDVETRKAVIVR
ncbi:MAG: M28 family peptidase [Candidatus Eisenbacteria bacterium]|nr:M28 family peptidase [Candidatus Eisenbacteria bacterium]